jgi:hypothetical protein
MPLGLFDDGLWPDDVPAPALALLLCNEKILLEEVFPEAESWKPERWLNVNERMELDWVPFGTGCRACPGCNGAEVYDRNSRQKFSVSCPSWPRAGCAGTSGTFLLPDQRQGIAG